MPSFITPEELRVGVDRVQELAAAAGREVPEDHFGTLINFAIAESSEAALAMAQPFIQRGRVDEAIMKQCTAFGPVDTVIAKVEEYVKGGASKFILRPLCPSERMLEQLAVIAEHVAPEYHRRSGRPSDASPNSGLRRRSRRSNELLRYAPSRRRPHRLEGQTPGVFPAGYTAGMRQPTAIALLALVLCGCSVLSIDFQPRIRPLDEETLEGRGSAKILLVDLSGVLQDESVSFSLGAPPPRVPLLARVREELEKAEKDDRVRAVIVKINSPGGTITASDILYREIVEFKARRKIPVTAVIMDVGASGGYYVALAADTIVVHPTSVTGSLGVVMLTVNAQGLMEKIGVAPLAIKSGPMKDAGSPFRPLTQPELQVFQGVIDDMYGRFVRLIAASRKIPEERVRVARRRAHLHRAAGARPRPRGPHRLPRRRRRYHEKGARRR